ncbi:MAG: hypothetical protein KGI56_09335, partial [Acidobacteriota bacterium]|nr:hypothetical protein [Acidobacteriota bacterium]
GGVEIWRDEHGTEWELADFGDGCLVRERNALDLVDGDAREGYAVIARFGDAQEAREFLRREGFDALGLDDA